MNQREAFEKWASKPPMEFYLARHDDTAAWPGNYKDYHVECAWQAWQSAAAIEREESAMVCEERSKSIMDMKPLLKTHRSFAQSALECAMIIRNRQ